MKKLSFLIFAVVLFAACGNNAGNDNCANEKAAEEYYEKAFDLQLFFSEERDSVLKAIALLDSAILLYPEYFRAYMTKQSLQLRIGELEEALRTIKILDELRPDNPDIKSSLGFISLLNDDDRSARTAFEQADSLWSIALDTVDRNNEMIFASVLLNKTVALKFLDKAEEADKLFNLFQGEITTLDDGLGQEIESFFRMSKDSIYQHLTQGLTLGK